MGEDYECVSFYFEASDPCNNLGWSIVVIYIIGSNFLDGVNNQNVAKKFQDPSNVWRVVIT